MQAATLKRIEVTGGFLHDLDLELAPGLNVIIGPRGAGKTSVLELLRYAFRVPAITPEANKRARAHALSVLADGSVSVTAIQDGEVVTASRDAHSAADAASHLTRALRPLIVSQREIEEIGLDAGSRMQILDGLVGDCDGATEVELLEQVEVGARALDSLLETVDRGSTRMLELAGLEQQLAVAEREAAAQGAMSDQLETEQTHLRELSGQLTELNKGATAKQDLLDAIEVVRERVGEVKAQVKELAKFDDVNPERKRVARATNLLREAHVEITAAMTTVETQHGEEAAQVTDVRRELCDQSEKLEALQAGAGDLARRLTRLREQQAERRQIGEQLASLESEIADAERKRGQLLDQLDSFRKRRFEWREKGARTVADMFDGEIEVRLTKNGQFDEYEAALAKALEGSGLQYKALARKLAPRITPRALVDAVEHHDSARIAELGQITRDRAERLIAHLRAKGSSSVLAAPLDDAVDYALLDGESYKPTETLSTGQRCTVILPLLMAQKSQLTILDQPEDHLDNACIVDTLVRAVRARETGQQLVIATHNANIPVLGAADKVIVLSSDGRRGRVLHAGDLNDLEVVQLVTSIMEGGEEAFQRRVAFYADHRAGAGSSTHTNGDGADLQPAGEAAPSD